MSRDGQGTKWNGAETLPKISVARVEGKNVADDRQTDGRAGDDI